MRGSQKQMIGDYLRMINKGFINSLIIYGKTGVGKSYTILRLAKEEELDYVYFSGYTTPLALYRFMYKNKDKILLFDDLEGVFNNELSVALLKSALGEQKVVFYETTKGNDLPSSFKFEGKIIILTNKVSKNKDEHFRALLSRATTFELLFTFEEMIKMCSKIIDGDLKLDHEQKVLAKKIIKERITPASEFNYRELMKLIKFIKYDKSAAEGLFLHSFKQDEKVGLVYELMNSDLPVSEQIKAFCRQTGYSRRSFFNIKKELKVHECNDSGCALKRENEKI